MITTSFPMSGEPAPRPQVYYLREDTDRDTHDSMCCCAAKSPLPHKAVGASLYRLDLEGARAWHALRTGQDLDSFADWCRRQESQGTSYGLDSQSAIRAALEQARLDGWQILNYPEPIQWPLPPDYQDSRARYQDTIDYRQHRCEPDHPPVQVDEAPFPIWIVPPGWRMARLSAIVEATGYHLPAQEAGVLLTLAGVLYADTMLLWGWKEAVVTWEVEKTRDSLVLWRIGR